MTEANITIEDFPGGKIASFSGQLDESNVDEKIKIIYALFETIPTQLKLILNLEKLEYMNSKSIGYITDIYGKTTETGGKVIIASARPNIVDILQVVGLTQLIPISGSLEEAKLEIASTASGKAPATEMAPAQVAMAAPEPAPTPEIAPAAVPAPEMAPAQTTMAAPATEPAPEMAPAATTMAAPAAPAPLAQSPMPESTQTVQASPPIEALQAQTMAAPLEQIATNQTAATNSNQTIPGNSPAEQKTEMPAMPLESQAPTQPAEGSTYKFEE